MLKRNAQNDQKNHRDLHDVFNEYRSKYKSVKKNQNYIDTFKKDALKNSYSFFITRELKKVINSFFDSTDQQFAYIAPLSGAYDCFIDTGKTSISASAQKIKEQFMLKLQAQ